MSSSKILFSVLGTAWLAAPALAQAPPAQGVVFSMTNAATANEIVVFDRAQHGALTLVGSVPTNGLGTGQALESQGSIAMGKSSGEIWLVAVNAGSNEITVFQVQGNTLTQTDKVASGGTTPISVTLGQGIVYVLNSGAPNNISGFELSPQGLLTPIAGSTWPLSAASTKPAQVIWSPSNELLLVSERDTEMLDTFTVSTTTNSPLTFEAHPAAGRDPLGIAFRGKHKMFVAESWANAADAGAVSGYAVRQDTLIEKAPSVPTTETATGWIVTMGEKPFAYVSNTGSNTISGYRVSNVPSMQLLDVDGVTATTGPQPADLATVRAGRFLYALNTGDGTISGWSVATDGSLTSLGSAVAGLPTTGAAGLVAR